MLVRRHFFNSFFRITRSTFPMLLYLAQAQQYCSSPQTTTNNHLYYRENFGLDTFR